MRAGAGCADHSMHVLSCDDGALARSGLVHSQITAHLNFPALPHTYCISLRSQAGSVEALLDPAEKAALGIQPPDHLQRIPKLAGEAVEAHRDLLSPKGPPNKAGPDIV